VQIFTDPRITARFARKTLAALAVYAAHSAIGITFLYVLIVTGHGKNIAPGVVIAFVGWIGLGVLGLIRFAPRLREPPQILMRFGIADIICLAVVVFGVVKATGLIEGVCPAVDAERDYGASNTGRKP